MKSAGKMIIAADGTILEADHAISVTLGRRDSIVGANALALTAFGDRDRCAKLVAQIVADGQPLTTEKRMIRADGSTIWVRNRLRSIGTAEQPRIEIEVEESQPELGRVAPDRLLRVARLVFESRRERTRAFGGELFTDHAWDMLLSAYICEAEGSLITIAQLHALTGISLATGSRWIRALAAEGLMEYEGGGNHAMVTTPFRLSTAAHHKFEFYLSHLHEKGATDEQVALGE